MRKRRWVYLDGFRLRAGPEGPGSGRLTGDGDAGLIAQRPPRSRPANGGVGSVSARSRAARQAFAARPRRRQPLFSKTLSAEGALVFAKACKLGLEGIVAKRAGSGYRSGNRRQWLKSKNRRCTAVTQAPRRIGSRSLGEFPLDVVRIDCPRCGRRVARSAPTSPCPICSWPCRHASADPFSVLASKAERAAAE